MLPFGYSIQNALEQGARYNGKEDPEGVCGDALTAIGLTENANEPATRVRVYLGEDGFNTWGVDVPQDRAEEFAKQLWKDSRTKSVMVGETDFPKPVEKEGKSAEDVQKEFDAFKKKVVELALRTKREEGWCDSGFERAMKDLGLEVPATKVRVVLELDLDNQDTDLTAEASEEQIKSFLTYDADMTEATVVSVEPIKD